jgi:hypothetical protein
MIRVVLQKKRARNNPVKKWLFLSLHGISGPKPTPGSGEYAGEISTPDSRPPAGNRKFRERDLRQRK